jgi:hypothetical protein
MHDRFPSVGPQANDREIHIMADASTTATFYDNYVPSLKAAEYSLTLSQALAEQGGGTSVPPAPTPPVTQRFIVRGPRFSLDPGSIHRVFPPANGTGRYHEYLPMLVANQRALPWERDLALAGTPSPVAQYPWMALLVFTEDELPPPGAAPPPGSQANPTRTASLPLSQVVMGQTPGPPAGTLGPDLKLEDDEPASTLCTVIDVPAATFVNLVPAPEDLRLLAHVRQVSLTGNQEPQAGDDPGWYSVVVANRFATPPPQGGPGVRNIAHLVSLEGFETCLPASGPAVPAQYQTVRMVSLWSWTFTCLADPAVNFETLMVNLVSPASEQGTDLRLRMPLPAIQPAGSGAALPRLALGCAPLPYATRSGENTFAWFRGPFTPVPTAPFLGSAQDAAPTGPVPLTSSQAMVYDPVSGVFDQSYAVAFQTGRSRALASEPFSTALMQWRRETFALLDLLADRLRTPHLTARTFTQPTGAPAAETGGTAPSAGAAGCLSAVPALIAAVVKGATAPAAPAGPAADAARPAPPAPSTPAPADGLAAVETMSVDELEALLHPHAVRAAFTRVLSTGLTSLAPRVGTVGPDARAAAPRLLAAAPGATPGATRSSQPAGRTRRTPPTPGELRALMQAPPVQQLVLRLSGLDGAAAGNGAAPARLFAADANGGTAGNGAPAASAPLPAVVVTWLAQTALLYGVPFNNLVPNEAMLPAESLRYFYVDPNWVTALIDGALSVGVQTSRDTLLQGMVRAPLHATVQAALPGVRAKLTAFAAAAPEPAAPVAGFLLRSALVSGWPGMEVKAFSASDPDTPMTPLRLDRVSPNVLLALYPGVPVQVQMNEPSEGLVFGREDEGIDARWVPGAAGAQPATFGEMLEPKRTLAPAQFPVRAQPATNPALVVGGAGGLAAKLAGLFDAPYPTLTPATLAVQMVRVPEQMLFLPEPPPPA